MRIDEFPVETRSGVMMALTSCWGRKFASAHARFAHKLKISVVHYHQFIRLIIPIFGDFLPRKVLIVYKFFRNVETDIPEGTGMSVPTFRFLSLVVVFLCFSLDSGGVQTFLFTGHLLQVACVHRPHISD